MLWYFYFHALEIKLPGLEIELPGLEIKLEVPCPFAIFVCPLKESIFGTHLNLGGLIQRSLTNGRQEQPALAISFCPSEAIFYL